MVKANVSNGIATININSDLEPGTYNICAVYQENDMYQSANGEGKLTIDEIEVTSVEVVTNIIQQQQRILFYVFKDCKGNNVNLDTLKFSGSVRELNGSYGNRYPLSLLNGITITITYSGDSKVKPFTLVLSNSDPYVSLIDGGGGQINIDLLNDTNLGVNTLYIMELVDENTVKTILGTIQTIDTLNLLDYLNDESSAFYVGFVQKDTRDLILDTGYALDVGLDIIEVPIVSSCSNQSDDSLTLIIMVTSLDLPESLEVSETGTILKVY